MTEEEQVEAIKKWWRQYGNLLLNVSLVLLIVFFGWRWWQQRQINITQQASMAYEQLQTSLQAEKPDKKAILARANGLIKHFTKTTYASLASLTLAKQYVDNKNFTQAKQSLQWVIDHNQHNALQQIARLRLASILLAEQQYQPALTLLKQSEIAAFDGAVAELRGDIYHAMNQTNKAKQAYQLAIKDYAEQQINTQWLQMKLNQLNQSNQRSAS